MEPPLYMRSIVDQNVIVRRMAVYLWIWVQLVAINIIYTAAEVLSNA